ncbi:hypothetical protein T492DRAFT_862304 [Pavlovales sp. CCMP2436]|nr:hypothetical protein T492DRAFT_862304 [Pavlovales sp. CCMP2436]
MSGASQENTVPASGGGGGYAPHHASRPARIIVYGREDSEATRELLSGLRGIRVESRPLEAVQPAPHRREALAKLRIARLLTPGVPTWPGSEGTRGLGSEGTHAYSRLGSAQQEAVSIEIPLVDIEGQLLQAPTVDAIVVAIRARGFAEPAPTPLMPTLANAGVTTHRLVVYSVG